MNVAPDVRLPSSLLEAIGAEAGGRVVFVIGAGCSVEPPSALPASGRCSREAFQRLVDDEILEHGDCPDPGDLSAVADAVFTKCGGQRELVRRLDKRFRYAEPNEGTILVAALLREGVVQNVVTLNFDLTLSSALRRVGAVGDVEVLKGPEDHDRLGARNVVYLHRNVDAVDPESLILRTAALDDSWREDWEQVIVQMALAAPVVVFAGLGTRVGVLVESSRWIGKILEDRTTSVQVDIGARSASVYAEALGISEENYIEAGWGQFMALVGRRVVKSYIAGLRQATETILQEGGVQSEELEPLYEQLIAAGLLYLGGARASWALDDKAPYFTANQVDVELIADLMLGIAYLRRISNADATFVDDGLIELSRAGRTIALVAIGTGRGVRTWLAAEARLCARQTNRMPSALSPTLAVLAHVRDRPDGVAAPEDIVTQPSPASIIPTGPSYPLVELDALRANPDVVPELVAAA